MIFKKRNLTECVNLAIKNHGTVETSVFKYKFLWKCANNHEWLSSLQSVEMGAWCPKCYFNDSNNIDPVLQSGKSVSKIYNILYKITNKINGKIYIGVHATDDLNDGYFGSGKLIKKALIKYGSLNFQREILEFFPTIKDALSREKQIVTRSFIKDKSNYNYAEGGGSGFIPKTKRSINKISKSLKGKVSCIDENGIKRKVSKEEFYSNPNLKGHTVGTLMMRDKEGNICRVKKDDPRIASEELVGSTAGICVMKDKHGKHHNVFKDDPRIASGELVGITKGSTQSTESNIKRSLALKGISQPQTHYHCKICNTKTNTINLIRWHNDNCKFKVFENPQEKAKQWELLSQRQKDIKMKKFKETGILDL